MRESAAAEGAVLAMLRAATRTAHRRLDQAPLVADLLKRDTGPAGYGRFLRQLHRAYQALEPGLVDYGCDAGPPYRRRLPALVQELRQLGLAPPPDPVEICPAPASAAAYWGARYVLDGSCHGARQLRPVLARRALTDCAYWDLLLTVGPDWSQVTARLEHSGQTDAARAAMQAAAAAVFEHFIASLQQEAA